MLKSIDTGWEGNDLEIKLRGELNTQPSLPPSVCPSIHPSIHPTAIPQCFTPVHPQQCREVGTHLGKVRQGRRCAVWCGARCGTAWSGADQGGELRAAGARARVWTCPYTPSTSGLHGRSVGGSPPWAGTRAGELFPSSRAQGGVRSWQVKGSPRLNYTGFACPTQATAASGETRAS